ncbi:MAG: T9SS type A sorting domain-containing protein [Bacteroidales bacterium]|nr:T9SS type A sorting domain-containing protein [Bacteroidales bacterium]
MKRYTSIKFILLTIMMLGSLLLKASSGIGIDASKILSIKGAIDTLNVASHEHIPQPYESLQDLLDDNPDLIINTSTDLNDIVLTHDRDELDDEDPIYKKYNRYYILKDETNAEYEIKQYIIKKIGVIIVGSGNASVSMYHDNVDPSTYNGGELYNDAVTNQHVYNYFPAGVNLVQNECPDGQLKITYTEKVYGEGNVEERCRTILERTYVIECELLGMTAKYNAVMQYVFLHHNQVIETSGTMETIKTEVENIADVAPYASLSELMAANPGLNVIAKDMHRLKVIYKNDVLSDENDCKDTYSRCYEIVDECTTGGDPLDVVKAVVYQNIELNKFSIKIINRFLEPFTYSCEGMPGEAHSNLAHLKNHGLVLDPSVDESDIIVSYHDLEDEVYPYYYTRVFYLKSIKCPEVEESIIQEYKPDFLYCYEEESPEAMYEICSKEDFDATLPKDKASALAYLQHQVAEGWLQQSEFNYLTFNYPPFNETSGTLTCTSYSEATAEPTDCVNHYWTVIQFNYNYKGRIYKSEWSGLTITYTYEEDLSENYPYKSIKVPNDTVFGCLDVSCLPQPMTAEELDEKYEDIKLPELCSDVSLEMKMNIELMDADGCHKEYKEWYTLKDYCTGLILYEIEHTVVLYDGLDISGTLEPFTYAPCDGTPTDEHANIDYLVSQGLVLGPDVDKNNITVTYHDMPDEEYPYYFTRAFFIRSTSCPKAKEEIVLQDYKPDYVYCFDELTPREEYEICSKEDFDATLPQNKALAMAFLQQEVDGGRLNPEELDKLTFNYSPFNQTSGTLNCYSYSVAENAPDNCMNPYWTIIEFDYDYKGRTYKSKWASLIDTYTYEEDISENYPYQQIKIPNDTVFGCLDVSCLPQPMKTIEEFEEKCKIELPELCDASLDIKFNDELINADGCLKEYKRIYELKNYCTGIPLCQIHHTLVLYDGIDVEGSLATYKYNVYDDECHAPDWRPTDAHKNIDYLISQGLVLGPDEDKDDIDVSYVDLEDEKYPYYFTRAFFLKQISCPKAKEEIVLQEYEPGVVHYYDAWENGDEGYEYVCKDDINSFIPESNYASAVEYINNYPLDTDLTQDDIDEILFNYAPFNEYGGNRSAKVESYTKSQKGGCETELDIEITIYYEYYGRIYESKFFDLLILRHYDKDEHDFDMQTLELPELTIDDCKDTGNGCMPEAMSTIEEFAEQGITIEQTCNDDGLLKFEVNDEKIDDGDLDCMDRYTRTYKIYCKCTNHLKYTITQKINIETNLDVYGYMPTIYYEDELPEAYTDLETMMNNGLKYEYSGDQSSLVEYSKDFVMEDIPNRTERRYYLSASCTEVIDSISQYLVKIFPEWSEFEVMEVNNVSESTFQDGSIVLKTPQDDQLEEGQTVMDAYEIILIDQSNNEYTFEPEAENHLIAKNLPAGSYILEVFPTEFDKKEPIYRFMGKITELKTEVAAVPMMSFASYNFYVLTFGKHYYYGENPETGASEIIYIQNNSDNPWNNTDTDWHYYFTVEDGKLLSSIWDGGEGFAFYPSIQSTYETNSNYWIPEETIQLTMNSSFITFHALHKSGKELTNRRIIYSSAICLSNDPNEIFGPAGFSDDKMISSNDRIEYKIMFENDPELATAAAARVKVTCPLHPHADSTTVRLGQYGFGDYIFDVPPMSTYYSKRLDLADSLGVWLDVTAGIDVDNNEMYWIFQSIDPETGVAPTDTIGFLPVNDTLTGCGEGFVTFSVMSIDGMKTSDTISEQANIIFDENDNILTNVYTNMFDAVAPTSVSVCDSSSVLLDYNLIFKSVATDDENGSGVRQVDLYVNVDSTQYVLVGSMYPDTIGSADTMSLSYRLGQGSLYQFVLQAVDNVGNKEPFSETAQISFVNNNPPLDIFLSNRFFYEDDEIGTVIGEFTTLDDQTSDAFTYSLVDEEGYDNDLFLIDGKQLILNKDLRCYGQYMFQILVKTEDVNGDSFNKMFILYAEQTMTPPTTLVDHNLCYGDYITIAGKDISEDGYYYDTIPTAYGCDSIVKHIVKHRPDPVVISYPDEFICMYEDYNSYGFELTWDSIQEHLIGWHQLYDTTLVFDRDSLNYYGCVDTVRVGLTIYPASRAVHDVIVCADAMPFIYGDSIFTKAGTKDVYFTSVITGCDSVVTVNLEVAPSHYDVPVFATICDNEYYMLFDDTIREAGTYYKMGESSHHCDSSVYLTLEVLPTSSGFGTLNICASELPYTYGDYTFDASTVSGTYDVVFPAANGCDSIVALELTVRQTGNQENNFSGSWDWYSTFLDDEQLDVLAELKEDLSSYGKVIKSNTEFINYAGGVWSGNLTRIDNEQMYMVQTNMPQPTLITACVANPEEHPITIKKDWNYIGYISQYAADVNVALAGLSVNPKDGDIIKSYRDGFAVYFESIGMWFGDLMMMQPGQGYQYMSKNNDDIVLTYPQLTQSRAKERAKEELNWSPSYKYPDNMTFVADIVVDDWVCDSDTLEVGAFCNGEKRGNARAIYIKELGAYRVFLTTYGNNGDELYFMLYDHESQEIAAQVSNQRIVFEVNATFGSLLQPYSFEFNTSYNTLIEESICFGGSYNENGFETSTEGSYFRTLKDENGNDSIVKLRLEVNPTYRIAEDILVDQFPYEYDGVVIEKPSVHAYSYTSVHGCDSIMVRTFMYELEDLMLVPNPANKEDRVLVLSNLTEEDKAGLVVEVYNAIGLKIQAFEPRRFPIELREIDTSGSYMIRVMTGTGKILTTKLIIM